MKNLHFKIGMLLCAMAAVTTGCGGPLAGQPAFVTATLPSTPTLRMTSTPPPPSPSATVKPVQGVANTQVNVRTGPGTDQATLGLIALSDVVQIVGKDSSGGWLEILYAGSPTGTGWVSAQFIRVASTPDVPIVGGTATPSPSATQQPAAVNGTPAASANTARALQKINVRSGPGTNYDALGLLNPDDQMVLTGKNETGTWLQIEYPSGPGGRGWVSVGFVEVGDISGLPLFDDQGTPAAAGTGAPAAPTPTATIAPALLDNDSLQSPAVNMIFSASGAKQFSYDSGVSSPQGDSDDWIALTAPSQGWLYASLVCTGNGTLQVQVLKNGAPVSGWGALACGSKEIPLVLDAGQTYILHLAAGPTPALSYVGYTLTVHLGQ